MDAEHVGAHAIHHMEEETLQYLGIVDFYFYLFFSELLRSFALKNWSPVRLWTATKRIPSPF